MVSKSTHITKHIKALCDKYLIKKDIPLIMALSGGSDSTVLATILSKLGYSIYAIHINYQKRQQANQDAKWVSTYCNDILKCKYAILKAPSKPKNENFQAWARQFRYDVLQHAWKKENAQYIVMAHHNDDQCETILHKILQGSSPSKWYGMDYVRDIIFRPLLDFKKTDILNYATEHNIQYCIDETNQEKIYARNLLRHEWLHRANKLLPGWRNNLLYLRNYANIYQNAMQQIFRYTCENDDILSKNKFLKLSQGIQIELLKYWWSRYIPNTTPSRKHLISLIQKIQSTRKNTIKINEKSQIIIKSDHIQWYNKPTLNSLPITIEKHHLNKPYTINDIHIYLIKNNLHSYSPFKLTLDAQHIHFPITLRSICHGDKLTPIGSTKEQHLTRFLTSHHIIGREKDAVKVLADKQKTIHAVLYPPSYLNPIGILSNNAKCHNHTKETIVIHGQVNNSTHTIHNKTFELLIPSTLIQEKVAHIAKKIGQYQRDKKLILLNACSYSTKFMNDLTKHINIAYHIENIDTNYNNMNQAHIVIIITLLNQPKNLVKLIKKLQKYNPAKITTLALLYDYHIPLPIHINHIGFKISNYAIVGYGIDYKGYGQSLNDIYVDYSQKREFFT